MMPIMGLFWSKLRIEGRCDKKMLQNPCGSSNRNMFSSLAGSSMAFVQKVERASRLAEVPAVPPSFNALASYLGTQAVNRIQSHTTLRQLQSLPRSHPDPLH